MHPTIAAELAALRHADLLRAVGNHRNARLALAIRPARQAAPGPALAALARSATKVTPRLRRRAVRLTALGSPRQSNLAPCC